MRILRYFGSQLSIDSLIAFILFYTILITESVGRREGSLLLSIAGGLWLFLMVRHRRDYAKELSRK